jgi:hypothetical protein
MISYNGTDMTPQERICAAEKKKIKLFFNSTIIFNSFDMISINFREKKTFRQAYVYDLVMLIMNNKSLYENHPVTILCRSQIYENFAIRQRVQLIEIAYSVIL